MSIHPGSIWLDTNWHLIPEGIWVAADATYIVTEGQNIETIYDTLQKLKVRLDKVTIAFIPIGIVQ